VTATPVSEIRYTLLADGPSDRALMPVLGWALRERLGAGEYLVTPQFANPAALPDHPASLAERMEHAIALFPCEILFVHRDAEREPSAARVAEIRSAAVSIAVPYVCVIPIRMTEAWLLIEERAIREAAGNPNGMAELDLPAVNTIETIVDPKSLLHRLLQSATEFAGRRRKIFNRDLSTRVQRVAELIRDYRPLRRLPAFRAMEAELQTIIAQRERWNRRTDAESRK
jgi:hypothetical protein